MVGTVQTLTLYARDSYGNLQASQTDVFTVVLTQGAITITGIVTAIANGDYQAQYTLTKTGTYLMAIKV